MSIMENTKKKRWLPKPSTNKYSNNGNTTHHNKNSKKMENTHLPLVLFSVIVVYTWIMLITYYIENGSGKGLFQDHRGFIFDLDKNSYNFEVSGFEYYENNPIKRKPGLSAKKVWFLRPLNHGKIVIKDIPKHMNRPTHVSVLIKYHLGRPARSQLSVSGINTKEVVTTDMSQYGNGYCTRILYFGFINEVAVQASVQKNGGFVIIDELLVGLGYYVFDGLEEETCSS